jgi:hypothetical protein
MSDSTLQPKNIKRLTSSVDLVAPPECHASVLLKLVHRDEWHRYYSWCAIVGRHDLGTVSVQYTFTGDDDTIQFDLPEGMALSAESLQPHLEAFLTQNEPDDKPPKIIER